MQSDIREIEAFLAVAQEMHFGRAGERLGLSTSRVSFLVKRLERRVGALLFERTSRRVALTAQGEYVLGEILPSWERIQRTLADVAAGARTRVEILRVGFSNTLPEGLAADLIAAFEQRHRGHQVIQSTLPTAEVLRWLCRDWMVDVMVTWIPKDAVRHGIPGMEIGSVILCQPRAVALAVSHPLADRAAIDIEELADHEVLYFVGLPQVYANGWTPPVTPAGRPMKLRHMNASYLEECLRMVVDEGAAHLTFTSVLDRYQVPSVVVVPVDGLQPMAVAVTWPDTATRHRLAPEFAQVALAHSAKEGRPRGRRS